MATIVALHAHPDDESIGMGGTLARAVDEGHRVVLVFGTRGECGEVADGFLDDGEELGDRRVLEVQASADALGVHRVEFLGYRDSGMDGEPTNDDPSCFWQADLDEAARRLAAILTDEAADVLTVYDDHGGYGHPDHVQVHRVGHRAAELAGTPHVLEMTMNRDHIRRMMEMARAMSDADGDGEVTEPEGPDVGDESTFGTPEADITTAIDVRKWVDRKRASMIAHASQIPADSFFLTMPDEVFEQVFGHEWFIRTGPAVGGGDHWLLPPAAVGSEGAAGARMDP